MDLIEVLWKQDVDLGYNPSLSVLNTQKESNEDDIEKLKTLLDLKEDKVRLFSEKIFFFENFNLVYPSFRRPTYFRAFVQI